MIDSDIAKDNLLSWMRDYVNYDKDSYMRLLEKDMDKLREENKNEN